VPCPDIAGNYTVTAERLSGSCDPSTDPKGPVSLSFTKDSTTHYTAIIPGVAGGCPGDYDTTSCKFRSACVLRTSTGELAGTINADFTFTASGYTGTTVSGGPCEVTYRETGSKL
jgi:hypothetical protein